MKKIVFLHKIPIWKNYIIIIINIFKYESEHHCTRQAGARHPQCG